VSLALLAPSVRPSYLVLLPLVLGLLFCGFFWLSSAFQKCPKS
jgi:hypothetical protein